MKVLIPFLAVLVASAHAAESWPQFRGPNGAGLAAEDARPPVSFGPDKNVRWKTSVPRGVSSPIVWGDRVFVTGVADGAIVTLALDAKDGREVWRKALPATTLEKVHAFSSPATATPCTDGVRVYVYANSFGVAESNQGVMSLHCDTLSKSAEAGAKCGGPTPMQGNRQPDHRHAHLPLKSIG